MNALYIIIPLLVLLFVTILFVRRNRRKPNEKTVKKTIQNKRKIKWDSPVFDKETADLTQHPPISQELYHSQS